MLQRETLSREHRELASLANAILDQVTAATPDFNLLGTLRWRMSRVLLVHLAKEDKLLYPQLSRSDRPGTAPLAQRFAEEMGGLARSFTEHVEDWPIQRALTDWPGFTTATSAILDRLHERIRREEHELYPLIA